MKIILQNLILIFSTTTLLYSCKSEPIKVIKPVDSSLFLTNDKGFSIKTVDCTLSDGTKTQCYEITTKSIPSDHEMGPWCPDNVTDKAEKGGFWFKDGKLYEVDGSFIKGLSSLYKDGKWTLYDENGTIFKIKTEEQCKQLSGAKLVDEFENFCIECLPEYVSSLTKTFIIPITPVELDKPINLNMGPPGNKDNNGPPKNDKKPNGPPPGGGPTPRGIAFNGVIFDAPAPLHIILKGYTIPPIDHAGGHINLDSGYHYHAATGVSKKIHQHDKHAPMIGYAMDGFGLYAQLNNDNKEPDDLDDCRGHYDDIRGYHYHVDAAGNNNFIDCFTGAIAQ